MDDAMKEDALQALSQVEEEIHRALSDLDPEDTVNLGSGLTGSLVFYSTLYERNPCAKYLVEARSILQDIFVHVAQDEFSEIGLYSGLAGIAWAVNYAIGVFGPTTLGISHSATDELDSLLVNVFQNGWNGQYDLVSGVVGIGIYSLEMPNKVVGASLFKAVVANLRSMAEYTSDGMTWHTPFFHVPVHEQAKNPNGWYNLGLAHGVPGVIALLGRACVLGLDSSDHRAMLESALKWLMHQSLSDDDPTFGFSTSLPQKRTAWCYGDLGIAVAILHAAMAFESNTLQNVALNLAFKSLSVEHSRSGVADASICHGMLGVSHIARRIFDLSGESRFHDQHLRWLGFALQGDNSSSLERFTCYDGSGRNRLLSVGYLTGLSGIGLALIDSIYDSKSAWNAPLMTDFTCKK